LQPADAPPQRQQFERLIEHMGSDKLLLFSTDYPHWQFDGEEALPDGLPEAMIRKILLDNPRETYPRLMELVQ
jgi:predicted TIM-barrel fold metal-dependent hydrolase